MVNEDLLCIAKERLRDEEHDLVYVADVEGNVICVYDDVDGTRLTAELNAMKKTFVSKIIAVRCGKNGVVVDNLPGKTIKALWESNEENVKTEVVLCGKDGTLNTIRLEFMIPCLSKN